MATASSKVEDFISEQLEAIDGQIQAIDGSKVVRAAQALLDQKAKLMAARRSLLGAGPKLTGGGGGTRVTQGEVVAWFEANEGEHSVEDIASAMGHSPEVVRGHLNRGKGERFQKNNNLWSLRDPENDPEEDDDE